MAESETDVQWHAFWGCVRANPSDPVQPGLADAQNRPSNAGENRERTRFRWRVRAR